MKIEFELNEKIDVSFEFLDVGMKQTLLSIETEELDMVIYTNASTAEKLANKILEEVANMKAKYPKLVK